MFDTLNVLAFAGSSREESFNRKLVRAAAGGLIDQRKQAAVLEPGAELVRTLERLKG